MLTCELNGTKVIYVIDRGEPFQTDPSEDHRATQHRDRIFSHPNAHAEGSARLLTWGQDHGFG